MPVFSLFLCTVFSPPQPASVAAMHSYETAYSVSISLLHVYASEN